MRCLLLLFLFLFRYIRSCAPPMSIGAGTDFGSMHASSNAVKLLGDPTQARAGAIALDSRAVASIRDPVDLFCYDFNGKCRWRNMEGPMIDELDWFQGSGFLDESKLRLATGTSVSPDGFYTIVASDKVLPSTHKAVLVSDIVDCQAGPAELRFMYWTSPGVRIQVCTKLVDHPYPNYDFCSEPFENGDPGPAHVLMPDLGGKPFQIFVRAENFIFQSANLQGGFGILDSIEYFGDLCRRLDDHMNPMFPTEFMPLGMPFHSHDAGSPNEVGESTTPESPFDMEPDQLVPLSVHTTTSSSPTLSFATLVARQRLPPTSTALPFTPETNKFVPVNAGVCSVLTCSFSSTTASCVDFVARTDWHVAEEPIGNPATGIRGDASLLPFNKDGNFAYVSGPKAYSRLKTTAFEVEQPVHFLFAYHKVSPLAEFRLIMKRQDMDGEQVIFEAPRTTIQSRRWFREARKLDVGHYDYLTFEVRNLPPNSYVGVDELVVLNERQQPFCSAVASHTFIESFTDNSSGRRSW